jgi:chromosome segregation ATPase
MPDYNQVNQIEQEKRKKRNDIQREVIMLESELHKVTSGKMSIEAEIARFKRDMDYLKSNMQQKQQQLRKMEQDMMMRQSEVAHLKKQLNLI